MNEQIISALLNLGAVGIILIWMTQTLVPKLQKQLDEAIHSFENQMEKERLNHRESLDKVLEHSKWMVELITKERIP